MEISSGIIRCSISYYNSNNDYSNYDQLSENQK